ncbi:MAG: proton-conducting transporter membrane subunit, partial [Infirmifilum sp.]
MTTELLLASIIVLFSSMLLTLFLERKHNISFTITIISLGLASILNGISLLNPPSQPIGEVSTDAFSQALLLIALLDMIIALIGFRDPSREYKHPGGLFLLVAASVLGLLGIAWSGSILMLFASWMLFSVSSYALMAIPRDGFSASGAAKYGLMGLAATNLFLLFLGILVSSTGTLSLYTHTPLAITTALGLMTLILASVGFKIGVFPFHAWLPDAYGYADPLPISVIAPLSKTAAVLVLYKLSVTLI